MLDQKENGAGQNFRHFLRRHPDWSKSALAYEASGPKKQLRTGISFSFFLFSVLF